MTARRIAAIALTGALVTGGAGAAVAAITKDDAAKAEQSILDGAAKQLNVTPDALRGALSSAEDAQLDQAVKDGMLTQAQADAIKARRKQSGSVLGGPLRGPGMRGFGPGMEGFGPAGPHGPDGPGGPGFGRQRGGFMLFGDLASALDLTVPKLFDQLRAGKSVADVAKAQGKSLDDVRAAVKAAAKTRADKAVAAGDITQAQEDGMLSHLDAMLANLDKAMPPFGKGPFGKGRMDRGGAPPLQPGGQPGSFVAPPGRSGVFS
jgi:hypothetical protein